MVDVMYKIGFRTGSFLRSLFVRQPKPDTRCAADRLAGEILANWSEVIVHSAWQDGDFDRHCEITFRGERIEFSSRDSRGVGWGNRDFVTPDYLDDMDHRLIRKISSRARADVDAGKRADREAQAAALLAGLTKGAA